MSAYVPGVSAEISGELVQDSKGPPCRRSPNLHIVLPVPAPHPARPPGKICLLSHVFGSWGFPDSRAPLPMICHVTKPAFAVNDQDRCRGSRHEFLPSWPHANLSAFLGGLDDHRNPEIIAHGAHEEQRIDSTAWPEAGGG